MTEGKTPTGSLVGGNPKFERFVNYMARMTVQQIDRELNYGERVLNDPSVPLSQFQAAQENIERLNALRPFEVEREEREKAAKKAANERRMARAVSGFADAFAKAGL